MEQLYEHHLARLLSKRRGRGVLRVAVHECSPRWQWWALALLKKDLPEFPYPKIDFLPERDEHSPSFQNIVACLKPFEYQGKKGWDSLVDWVLFHFGDPTVKSIDHIDEKTCSHFKDTFDAKTHIRYPGDFFGHYYETRVASNSLKSHTGFFSTPSTLAKLCAQMTMEEGNLLRELNEPCCGSGRMLMEASNYCVHLSGQDINHDLIKVCSINGWLYMPSLVMPCKELKKKGPLAMALPNITNGVHNERFL